MLGPLLTSRRQRTSLSYRMSIWEASMSILRRLASLISNLIHKGQVERDLHDEIRSFLDMLTEEKVREGLSPDSARRAARIEIGGLEQAKEQVREARAGALLEDLWR